MQEKLKRFEELLKRELGKELDKVTESGSLSPENIKTLKDAMKLMKLMNEYSEDDGYSNRRGRSKMTGRYVSRDGGSFGSYEGGSSNRMYKDSYRDSYESGYSGHSIVEKLERMYDDSHNDHEREMIREWIRRVEEMGQ